MHIHIKNTIHTICIFIAVCSMHSCRKLISISEPINTITTTQIFKNQTQANGAMAGIYTRMINGEEIIFTSGERVFSAGLATMLGGLSSDELFNYTGAASLPYYVFATNQLTVINSELSTNVWISAYKFIYGANSVIEGIKASDSPLFGDSARNSLIGEAKFIRAFCYFYLTNFFGDVPLALTVDFNQTVNMPRTPQQQVYQQIVQDLKDAQAALPDNYTATNNQRIRASKWAATALLARVYLFMRDYTNAAAEATTIIDNTSLFGLEPGLNDVFLTGSREAIWQLQQTTSNTALRNATPEGDFMLPTPLFTGLAGFCLTDQLLNAFEPGDQRLTDWVDSTDNSDQTGTSQGITYYPYKYKIGKANSMDLPATEYYMVLRLAEIYLIRAEARANGAEGGIDGAISDLNMIRWRAGLPGLLSSSQEALIAAVAKERQTELFAEWGHRWLDLKRTGRASEILSAISLKQPWTGDYQLVYPIPSTEIQADPLLIQNIGY